MSKYWVTLSPRHVGVRPRHVIHRVSDRLHLLETLVCRRQCHLSNRHQAQHKAVNEAPRKILSRQKELVKLGWTSTFEAFSDIRHDRYRSTPDPILKTEIRSEPS